MQKNDDQDAKQRFICFAQIRILVELISIQDAPKIMVLKLGVSWRTARQWEQAAQREGRVVKCVPEGLDSENARPCLENQKHRGQLAAHSCIGLFHIETRCPTLEMIPFIGEWQRSLQEST